METRFARCAFDERRFPQLGANRNRGAMLLPDDKASVGPVSMLLKFAHPLHYPPHPYCHPTTPTPTSTCWHWAYSKS